MEDAEYAAFGDAVVGVLLRVTGLRGGLEGIVSMFQEERSSKEKSEWVVAVAIVMVVVEGRATNPDNRLDCPTLKIVVCSDIGTGPLPPFLGFFFRGAFALEVASEVGLDCVVMDCCLEACLNGVELGMGGATGSFLSFVAIRMVSMEVVEFVRWRNGKVDSLYS